jgi:hypothetical protein
MPLGVRQYYAKRTITLSRATRRTLRAEDRVATIRGKERMAYQRALQYQQTDQQDEQQQASHALAMSRAVIQTLIAEKQYAGRLIREAEIYSRVATEMAEAAEDRVALASQQFHNLLQQARLSGVPEDILPPDIQPRSDPRDPSNAANNRATDDSDSYSSDTDFSEEADEDQSMGGESDFESDSSEGSDIGTRHHAYDRERDGDSDCPQPEIDAGGDSDCPQPEIDAGGASNCPQLEIDADGNTSDSQTFYDAEDVWQEKDL